MQDYIPTILKATYGASVEFEVPGLISKFGGGSLLGGLYCLAIVLQNLKPNAGDVKV